MPPRQLYGSSMNKGSVRAAARPIVQDPTRHFLRQQATATSLEMAGYTCRYILIVPPTRYKK